MSEQFFNELTKREEGRQLCQAQVRVESIRLFDRLALAELCRRRACPSHPILRLRGNGGALTVAVGLHPLHLPRLR